MEKESKLELSDGWSMHEPSIFLSKNAPVPSLVLHIIIECGGISCCGTDLHNCHTFLVCVHLGTLPHTF